MSCEPNLLHSRVTVYSRRKEFPTFQVAWVQVICTGHHQNSLESQGGLQSSPAQISVEDTLQPQLLLEMHTCVVTYLHYYLSRFGYRTQKIETIIYTKYLRNCLHCSMPSLFFTSLWLYIVFTLSCKAHKTRDQCNVMLPFNVVSPPSLLQLCSMTSWKWEWQTSTVQQI